MEYDMKLLKKLNKEYADKRIKKVFSEYTEEWQVSYSRKRLERLKTIIDIQDKRVLEIGCGRGYTSMVLAKEYGCDVTGVDISRSDEWDKHTGDVDNLNFIEADLTQENQLKAKTFDLIISYAVWEHIRHPFEMLKQASRMIKEEGAIYIFANLYRASESSHLYREIYFPFPHLLFDEETLIKYAEKQGAKKSYIDAFFFLNKLCYPHYEKYFKILNLDICFEKLYKNEVDKEFYKRFEDKLSRYPMSDLELAFFEVVLKHSKNDVLNILGVKGICINPSKENCEIRWEADVVGHNLEYAWYIYKDDQIVFKRSSYSKENCYCYKPNETGHYYVKVFVRKQADSNSKQTKVSNKMYIEID